MSPVLHSAPCQDGMCSAQLHTPLTLHPVYLTNMYIIKAVPLQTCHSELTSYARSIPNTICAPLPANEHAMLDTCRGSWFSIKKKSILNTEGVGPFSHPGYVREDKNSLADSFLPKLLSYLITICYIFCFNTFNINYIITLLNIQ
jgi:hypothetical protein